MTVQNSTPFRSRDDVSSLFLVVLARFKRSGRLLDLGCNTGTDMIHAAQHGWIAEGCDFDPKVIAEANQRFRADCISNVSAYCLSVQDYLKQTPYTYDLVSSIDVLSFIPPKDMPEVLRRIGEVVKPGGMVLLRVFTPLETVVTPGPGRTHFQVGQLAKAFPNFEVIEDRQEVVQDPGHVSRPKPHEHHIEVFIAKKK